MRNASEEANDVKMRYVTQRGIAQCVSVSLAVVALKERGWSLKPDPGRTTLDASTPFGRWIQSTTGLDSRLANRLSRLGCVIFERPTSVWTFLPSNPFQPLPPFSFPPLPSSSLPSLSLALQHPSLSIMASTSRRTLEKAVKRAFQQPASSSFASTSTKPAYTPLTPVPSSSSCFHTSARLRSAWPAGMDADDGSSSSAAPAGEGSGLVGGSQERRSTRLQQSAPIDRTDAGHSKARQALEMPKSRPPKSIPQLMDMKKQGQPMCVQRPASQVLHPLELSLICLLSSLHAAPA